MALPGFGPLDPNFDREFRAAKRGFFRFGAFVTAMIFVGWAAGIALLGVLGYVAWHFLAKVW